MNLTSYLLRLYYFPADDVKFINSEDNFATCTIYPNRNRYHS